MTYSKALTVAKKTYSVTMEKKLGVDKCLEELEQSVQAARSWKVRH